MKLAKVAVLALAVALALAPMSSGMLVLMPVTLTVLVGDERADVTA